MKIAIHSDLHLEGNKLPEGFASNADEVDIVVLAGDIGVRNLELNLFDIREAYGTKPILFVPGNHEYYGYEFFSRREEMKEICSRADIFFMQSDKGYSISDDKDDYYFIGSTCWADAFGATDREKEEIQMGISDFYKIAYGDREFTVADMIAESGKERKDIDRILGLTLDEDIFDGKVIVVSHFPPLVELGNPAFPPSALTKYFHNSWGPMIWKADAWIYGHTHYNSPLVEHDDGPGRHYTKFLSNQRGYNKEPSNKIYNPAHVVEI